MLLHIEKETVADTYRLYLNKNIPEGALDGNFLLRPQALKSVLSYFGEETGLTAPAASASLLIKKYVRGLCGLFYLMSMEEKAVGCSLSNIRLVIEPKGELRLYVVSSASVQPAPTTNKERKAWRDSFLHQIFANHLTLLYREISAKTHLSLPILWENTLVYLKYFYEAWAKATIHDAIRQRIEADYQYIVEEADGLLFGLSADAANPLSIKGTNIPHPLLEDESFRVRQTCCLRYQLQDGLNCTTCPRLNFDERKARLLPECK